MTRSTVGGILAWFAYAIGIEAILAGRITGLRPRLLFPNLAAFLQGISLEFREPANDRLYHLGAAGGLVLLIAVTVVVAGLGLLAFDRRDVT